MKSSWETSTPRSRLFENESCETPPSCNSDFLEATMPLISKHELKQQFPLWYQITAMIACSANVPQVVETFSGRST